MHDQISRLRVDLEEAQNKLIEAEADLADRLADVNAFEFEFEAKVGHLMDALEALETAIQRYNVRIQIARSKELFGYAHIPVETQYRRTWQKPPSSAPTPPPQPLKPANETEIKTLYRRLARRFHPDMAANETDRLHRTEKMQAVNDAYAARSLTELIALAQEPDSIIDIVGRPRPGQTEAQLVQALQAELARCERRLRDIEQELRNLRHRPSVELSLEVKMARRLGRDLLAEMATEFEQKIARKTVEHDMLKAQFDQLGPDQGIINIDRQV